MRTRSHAPSAARYLQERLACRRVLDVPVAAQTAELLPRGSSISLSHSPFETCRAVRPMWVRITAVAFSTSRFLIAITN